MKAIIPETVFISAQLDNYDSDSNSLRNEALYSILEDLGCRFQQTHGYYKGSSELSFMVILEPNKGFTEKFFANIAFENFGQESILYRDNTKTGYLLYNKGKGAEKLGKIVEITEKQAKSRDNYTYFPMSNRYVGIL
jgi:hypothetical protein